MVKKVFIGSDHAGFELKEKIKDLLSSKNIQVEDLGTYSKESCDYPVFAKKVCEHVLKEDSIGILICGTGIGMSMCANRFKGIRAALCTNEYMAKMSRLHNDANILCLGARVIGESLAKEIVEVFISTPFEEGRHLRRINLIDNLV